MSEYIRQPSLEYQVVDRLKEQWREFVAAKNGNVDQVKPLLLELSRRYISRGRRHYHNIFHIADGNQFLELYRHLAKNFTALKPAWDGHDVVYIPGSEMNEQESAEFMGRMLGKLEMPPEIIRESMRLILLTKKHETTDDDTDGKLIIDTDLSILAADPEKYKRYTQAIKREYVDAKYATKKEFRAGRATYLEGLLERDSIFLTKEIREQWEDAAQQNVRNELQRLKALLV